MSKRFTDTDKYKKPFLRGLQGAYKLLWDYLYHDCNHAGIWIVDFDIAQIYIGLDMPVNKIDALKYFNEGEIRIIEFGCGKKWFIPSYIEFQYGKLNIKNRVHESVINILSKYDLYDINKGLISPLQGAKDKDKDKDKDIYKEKDKDKEPDFVEEILNIWIKQYKENRGIDYVVTNKGKDRSAIGKILAEAKTRNPDQTGDEVKKSFESFFKSCLNITDKWLFENMNPSIIWSQFNKINQQLSNGKARQFNAANKYSEIDFSIFDR